MSTPTPASALPPTVVNPKFEHDLRVLLKAGQQLIAINGCSEMYRARLCIQQVATTAMKESWTVFVWNPSRGFTWSGMDKSRNMLPVPFIERGTEEQYLDPAFALRRIPLIPTGTPGCTRAIFIFLNLHVHLDQFLGLRDTLQTLVNEGKFTSNTEANPYKRPVILLHPAAALHKEIRHHAAPVQFPPANEQDLATAIGYVGTSILGGKQACPPDLRDRMASSMLGLTWQQAEDVTAMCIAATNGWREEMLDLIEQAKADQIGQEGYLTYVPRTSAPALGDIGGWDLAEEFVRRQCYAYTPQGRKMKLKVPRGILALGLPGTGKCLGKGTPVLMFDGTIRPVEDIVPGDLLMGPDSRPRRVLDTTRGHGPLFRVTPTKGMSYVVNEHHVLSLHRTDAREIVNIDLRTYRDKSKATRARLKGWRTGVDWEAHPVPYRIPPYVLGVWLGDGSRGKPEITTPDPEVVAALRDCASALDLRFVERADRGAAKTYAIVKEHGGRDYDGNVFLGELRCLGIAEDKRIPRIYLISDRATRLELLAGLIDADGYLSCGGYEIVVKSPELAADILFLARSLGFAAYARAKEAYCQTGGGGIYSRIFISGDVTRIPVRVPRRKAGPRRQVKDVLRTGIAVEPIGDGHYYGFQLDGDHLFLLGDFTVTHNSMFAKIISRIIYDVTGQVFPTYKLNYDALFGGIVGETEANVRRLLEILAAQKRYILVVDEMEKFLGTNSLENDGGVSRKASAKFLDWLSERVLRTDDDTDFGYVIGTMNSLAGLEPEFLRRFNATFFVDLPDPLTREEILKIQLRLNHVNPADLRGADGKPLTRADWDVLIHGTNRFSGSEIEQAVILAREFAAASHGVDIRQIPLEQANPELARPNFEILQEAVALTAKSIMSQVHGERIQTIREWCKDRALPVHNPVAVAVPDAPGRRGGRAIDTN